MAEGSTITEEAAKTVGSLLNMGVHEIEKGLIKQYCKVMGETSPLYQDEDYARKSKYGGLIVPPGFMGIWKFSGGSSRDVSWKDNLTHSVDAGEKYEFYKPVHPGDVLFFARKLAGLSERESKSLGKMQLRTFEVTYTNRKGELVVKETKTSFVY